MAQFTDNKTFSFDHSNILGAQLMELKDEGTATLLTFRDQTKLGLPGNLIELFNETRKAHVEK